MPEISSSIARYLELYIIYSYSDIILFVSIIIQINRNSWISTPPPHYLFLLRPDGLNQDCCFIIDMSNKKPSKKKEEERQQELEKAIEEERRQEERQQKEGRLKELAAKSNPLHIQANPSSPTDFSMPINIS